MIIAIAFACFVLGFSAAIASSKQSSGSKHDAAKLLKLMSLILSRRMSVRDVSTGAEVFVSSGVLRPQSKSGLLLTESQVDCAFESSSWQHLAYQDFKAVVLAKKTEMVFPCIYATMNYRIDDHRYVFLMSDNPAEPRNIRIVAPALRQYLSICRSLGANTSLVIFAAPSETDHSVERYNRSFWNVLRGLRIIDRRPWPNNIPGEIDSEEWTFCFDGEPVFPVMLTPTHSQRWSRHMSVPVIALQPKWVLDRLLSTPERRDAATKKVRRLLEDFDQVDVSPGLTSYGQEGTSEARQLCLLDRNETSECPYSNLGE